MVRTRHPDVAAGMILGLTKPASDPVKVYLGRTFSCLEAVVAARDRWWRCLVGKSWPREAKASERTRDREPNEPGHGWQKVASRIVHEKHKEDSVWPVLPPSGRASVRSHSGPLASLPSPTTRCQEWTGRVLLLRSLRLPLPLFNSACRCGRLLDVLGHQWWGSSAGGCMR